ncbi:helix-turn-helix domain-containing protein [Leadbetterella byssophila]|jgi:AraC-like DNA-binding protein|uniref:Transcriptional regulator, AraC family n=1 Tax=Leadbetterella byssophila (strain DSM 17132 / JCM 16389 / KACC 11308 / NBRC 106382 / 4M15) TaxID=649349 RepID=E4RU28_LEAB4|nr:AraC family transcriptional regulator [Leadbetterella byssophila]ADQ16009.1 transcriptional regulator, AraC family [Leadbetterella byssophila DSM 17132]
MKPLQFTIPVTPDKSVLVQEDRIPHFYPYLHRHKEAQLIWVRKGSGTLIVDNNFHDFTDGDIFLIAPQQSHVFRSNSGEPEEGIHTLSVFYDPDGSLNALLNLPELRPFHGFIKEYRGGFKVPHEHVAHISKRMLKIQKATHTDQIIHFLHLLRAFCKMEPKPVQLAPLNNEIISEGEGLRMGKIYNYVLKNYKNPLTLDDVAAAAHLTPQAFCRYFKKHTGVTFVTFLNELRVTEACKNLTSGKFDNISSVAYSCGFNSIANFNRVFKNVAGTSPKDYLTKYLKNVS